MKEKPQIATKHFEKSLNQHGDLGEFPYGGGTHGENNFTRKKLVQP